MAINFELVVEQSQKLVMTPALQQAIALLQYSTPELMDFIRQEAENNPLLEIREYEHEYEQEYEHSKDEEEKSEIIDDTTFETLEGNFNLDFSRSNAFDWNDYFNEELSYIEARRVSASARSDEGYIPIDLYTCNEKSLVEQLLFQLQISMLDKDDFIIGEYLIGNLDSYGYLQGEICEHADFLGVSTEKVLSVLRIIQKFEPSGVGARNLEECLLIQMEARPDTHPLAKIIVQTYLAEIAAGKHRFISRKTGISLKDLQNILDFIRTLNPKPGACLGGSGCVRYISPDVLAERVDGEYFITVNESIPKLSINSYYRDLILKDGEEMVQGFIKKRLDSALWLIRSIEQRRITLFRVTQEIVRFQKEFLEKGIHFLRPLTLKKVADALRIHESTVCRAIANKFVQTPRGLYPLKFFFTGGLCGPGGGMRSVHSVKTHLKQLIQDENPSSPYSDQEIEFLLKKDGINVSRRTVTKYRKEMDILPSYKRRRI